MDTMLLLARLFLAGVFLVAGIAKLADLRGSQQAMRDFGVPPRLAAPLGTILPLAEIGVALALLARATAWWAALAALALLLAFVAAIGANMARGKQPDCHCFGQLHSAPAGPLTLLRNGALAAVAAFILWAGRDDPGSSATGWAASLSTAERTGLVIALVALVAVAIQGWLLVHLLRQHGRVLIRLEAMEVGRQDANVGVERDAGSTPGLPVGTPAPDFRLSGLHGETMTLDALRTAGKPVVLIFSDPGCGPCNALLPEIGRWQQTHAGTMIVAIITRGTADANRAKAAEHGLMYILLQSEREVAEAYEANATPTAVVVRPDGTIGSPLSPGAEAIRALVARTAGVPPPAPTIPLRHVPSNGSAVNGSGGDPVSAAHQVVSTKVGVPVPAMLLPDLDGNDIDLSSFQKDPTVFLFWNPGCGYCARMLEDVKAWDAASDEANGPRLVVISTGDVESNKEMGLRSPVLLDQGFVAGRAFGATGTPSAVLVDADGMIASEVAVGATSVFALATLPRSKPFSADSKHESTSE
jgi:peroxiredoxin/uncharacterized membrane protein YphA (DoxX/SURF4 family)